MVTFWGSFSDGLHHPHPGIRLCVPPRGPAHLHRAAQVCSHDGKPLVYFGREISCITKMKATVSVLSLADHILVTCTTLTLFWNVLALLVQCSMFFKRNFKCIILLWTAVACFPKIKRDVLLSNFPASNVACSWRWYFISNSAKCFL